MASQLWTSIELETQGRGQSQTLAAIDCITYLPSFDGVVLPTDSFDHAEIWTGMLRLIVRLNLHKLWRN